MSVKEKLETYCFVALVMLATIGVYALLREAFGRCP